MFGFKSLRHFCPRTTKPKLLLANKKAQIVLNKSEFRHDAETLRKNIPRYCNGNGAGLGISTEDHTKQGNAFAALYALADTVLARV